MTVSLLVPFRSQDAQRQRVWEFLRDQCWRRCFPDLEIVEGSDYSSGPWVKAYAWRDALLRSSGDWVIFMDADCWVPRAVEGAVALADDSVAWVQSQEVVWRLSEAHTAKIIEDPKLFHYVNEEDSIEDPRYSSAGVGTCLRRQDALDIPLDPRFVGWGWEDPAWCDALTVLLGKPWRFGWSTCYHLWHPPAAGFDVSRPRIGANYELRRRYGRARRQRDPQAAMNALLDEIRR